MSVKKQHLRQSVITAWRDQSGPTRSGKNPVKISADFKLQTQCCRLNLQGRVAVRAGEVPVVILDHLVQAAGHVCPQTSLDFVLVCS